MDLFRAKKLSRIIYSKVHSTASIAFIATNLTGLFKRNLPIILSLILFLVIFYIRFQQGGWEFDLDLFPNMRESLDKRISQTLPSPQAELLSGILLGNKKDLPYDLKLALRDSSTLHIVVVSGQNLTLLAALFMSLSGILKRKVAILISILAVIFYTLLTGAQIPVLRAAVMAILAFLAQIFGRERDGIRILIITAGVFLLINPKWLLELSFNLSFFATFGVIAVAPLIKKHLEVLPLILKEDIAISIGAQLMVAPLIAQTFHQLSIVSILANILVGWTIPFIMIFGTITLIFPILSILPNVLLTYFIFVTKFFASLPFAWVYFGEKIWIFWVGYYILLGGVLLALRKRRD